MANFQIGTSVPTDVKFSNGVYVSAINTFDRNTNKNITIWHKGVYLPASVTTTGDFFSVKCPGAYHNMYHKDNAVAKDSVITTLTTNGGLPLWYNSTYKNFYSNQSSDTNTVSNDFNKRADGLKNYPIALESHSNLFRNVVLQNAADTISAGWISTLSYTSNNDYSHFFQDSNLLALTPNQVINIPYVRNGNFAYAFSNAKMTYGPNLDPRTTVANIAYMFYNFNVMTPYGGAPNFSYMRNIVANLNNNNAACAFYKFNFNQATDYQGRFPGWWNISGTSTTDNMFAECSADPGVITYLTLNLPSGSHQRMFDSAKLNYLSLKASNLGGQCSSIFGNQSFDTTLECNFNKGDFFRAFNNVKASYFEISSFVNGSNTNFMFGNSSFIYIDTQSQYKFNFNNAAGMFSNCRNLLRFGCKFPSTASNNGEGFRIEANNIANIFNNTNLDPNAYNQGAYNNYYLNFLVKGDYTKTSVYTGALSKSYFWKQLASTKKAYLRLGTNAYNNTISNWENIGAESAAAVDIFTAILKYLTNASYTQRFTQGSNVWQHIRFRDNTSKFLNVYYKYGVGTTLYYQDSNSSPLQEITWLTGTEDTTTSNCVLELAIRK